MILGLFSQLLGPGGIQRIGRHTAASLSLYAEQHGRPFLCYGFNDPVGIHQMEIKGIKYTFEGCGRNKIRFVSRALRNVTRVSMVYLGHVHLAPIGLFLKLLKPNIRYWVEIYGIDAWVPLSVLKRLGLKASERTTSVCQFTANKASEVQRIDLSKFVVIPPALDPSFLDLGKNAQPAIQEKKSKVLLTCCRLDASEKYKGMDTVIRALPKIRAAVPDTVYFIVGDGDDRQRLEQLAVTVGVEDYVVFTGARTTEELPGYYTSCDVFLMPSRAEGWPSVYMEAMWYGKPAIGCYDGGTPEVVLDGQTGFLVPYDEVNILAERVIQLLQDEELCQKLGDAGRCFVEENLTFSHRRQRLFQLVGGNPLSFTAHQTVN